MELTVSDWALLQNKSDLVPQFLVFRCSTIPFGMNLIGNVQLQKNSLLNTGNLFCQRCQEQWTVNWRAPTFLRINKILEWELKKFPAPHVCQSIQPPQALGFGPAMALPSTWPPCSCFPVILPGGRASLSVNPLLATLSRAITRHLFASAQFVKTTFCTALVSFSSCNLHWGLFPCGQQCICRLLVGAS